MSRYYDRDGRPIDLWQWSKLMEDREYQVLQHTVVNKRWLVSTVWLGLDHGFAFLGDPTPLIFETMVFNARAEAPRDDLEMRRYTTEREALRGHQDMVQLVTELDNVEQPRTPEV